MGIIIDTVIKVGKGFSNAVAYVHLNEDPVTKGLRLLKMPQDPQKTAMTLRGIIRHLGWLDDKGARQAKIGEVVDAMHELGYVPSAHPDIGGLKHDWSDSTFKTVIQHALHQLKQDGTVSLATLRFMPGGLISQSEMNSPMVR